MRLLFTFAADPVGVSRALPGVMRQRRGSEQGYEADEAWEEHLHNLLGAPWPCPQARELDELVTDIGALLAARSSRIRAPGPPPRLRRQLLSSLESFEARSLSPTWSPTSSASLSAELFGISWELI